MSDHVPEDYLDECEECGERTDTIMQYGERFVCESCVSYLESIVVGARCGLCGKWMEHELVPRYWRVSICEECIEEAEDER